ncbi:MAG: HAD hydrolase-like protein [Succinivibrio sp.]
MMNKDYSHIDGRRDLRDDSNFDRIISKLKAVVFDLDGTLTDSIGQILGCTHATFDYLSLPQPEDKAIMSTIGLELEEALTTLLPEECKHMGAKVTRDYREIFKSRDDFQIDRLFDGIEPLLKKLRERDLKIGYASGRSMTGIMRTMDATVLGDYCDGICAGSEVPSKPDPKMMHVLCDRLSVPEDSVLGVGDSGLDIRMYQNAGCMSLGVQTGVWSGDALKSLNPDMLLAKIGDLNSYFAD